MGDDPLPEHFLLLDALVRWTDPTLLGAVKTSEQQFSDLELVGIGRPQLMSATERRNELTKPKPSDELRREMLDAAWAALDRDFKARIEGKGIYLSGVPVTCGMSPERQAIDGVWASIIIFDFGNNRLKLRSRQYVAVHAAKAPFPGPQAHTSGLFHKKALRPEDIPSLDDETVLKLLEEHVRRVIASPDAKLIAPGKISLMPIVRGKMRHRAENNKMLGSISAESRWLEGWIRSKVTLFQTPTAPTIAKVLGAEYRLLYARSNAAIQPSKL